VIAAQAAPANLGELIARAQALHGSSLGELQDALGADPVLMRAGKGKAGDLLERALGAVGGNFKGPDFPALGVELKTIPVDLSGRVRESTFVCSLSLREAERLDFEASPLFAKLRHVLWIPIVIGDGKRRIGHAFAWRPTSEQLDILRGDYDDLVGMIAIGKIESLTARFGRWLQVRPKAAHGRVRTRSFNEDGEPLWTIPRGFYLRARFTTALLRAPRTADV
jgi:DNA mismatch repair protein MutH